MMKKIFVILSLLVLSMGVWGQYVISVNGGGGGGITLPLDSLIVGQNGTTIDSIKVIGGEIYIYSGVNVFSGDTLSGFYATTNKLNLLNPANKTLVVDNTDAKKTITTMFMGYRKLGDSIMSEGSGAALNENNQLVYPLGVTSGVQSVVDGYMSNSAGTNTITSANDSYTAGNEAVTGRRLYNISTISLGYDTANYILINGDAVAGATATLPAIGDQSSYFFNTIDSTGIAYASRVFWRYTTFWTNRPTRDYPSATLIGPVPLYCTGTVYDAVNNETKVYYSDSILSLGTSGWITSGRLGSPGTGNFSTGTNSSTHGGDAAVAFGLLTRAWDKWAYAEGNSTMAINDAAHAEGRGTVASGNYSHAQNEYTTASGTSASAAGVNSEANAQGSYVVGIDGKSHQYQDMYHFIYNSVAKFTNVGDNQAGLVTFKTTGAGAGWHTHYFMTLQPNTSYTGTTQVVCVQNTNTVGNKGESGSWVIEWAAQRGRLIVIDSINLTTNRVYYTGDSVDVNTKTAFTTYTTSAMSAIGTQPGGVTSIVLHYIRESGSTGSAKWVTLSSSAGGAERDITSFTSAHYNTFSPWQITASTQRLVGRSFVNDGDDIGNGTSTGIRATMPTTGTPTYYGITVRLDGLANRTMRWVSTTNYVMVKSE